MPTSHGARRGCSPSTRFVTAAASSYYSRSPSPTHFGARELLGKVFWCGCEAIFFTVYNIYTNYERIFPAPGQMHSLPYDDEEEV